MTTATAPVEPEYTATEYLRLIAEGWEVIESTGSQMTIQNPEDDGPQELVIDVDAMLSAAPAPEGSAHPCYDEHQPGCDCVIPAQKAAPTPSYLERLSAPAEAGEWITGDQLHEIMQSFTDRADVSEIASKINAAIALRAQPPARGEAPTEAEAAEWSRFKQMCEEKLSVAIRADHGDAPFPMDESEAASYHRTRADLLGWVLDMWPTAEDVARSKPPAREDYSSLIAARCLALPGKLVDCPVCGAVDNERARQAREDAQPVAWAIFWRHAMTLHPTLEDAETARKGVPHDIVPLYTHPAPDVLRSVIYAATDAVLPAACDTTGNGTQARAKMQVEIADGIIAALQAEQKGGA